jgi:hypothetical protein
MIKFIKLMISKIFMKIYKTIDFMKVMKSYEIYD